MTSPPYKRRPAGLAWKYQLEEALSQPVTAPAWAGCMASRWLDVRRRPDDPHAVEIIVQAGYAWDGCTAVPDVRGTVYASCLHDALYQFAEILADLWGVSVHDVLRWADAVFLARMRADGCPCAGLYGWGVRRVGYAFHVLARWFRRTKGKP
jgi:hypothetical protein